MNSEKFNKISTSKERENMTPRDEFPKNDKTFETIYVEEVKPEGHPVNLIQSNIYLFE